MKKFLSLVLALVMTMSLVTVSAGAKDFTDDDKITYEEAVNVISTIGVVDGYEDGNFNPQGSLTRGAAAKIICNMILGPTTAAELHADTAPYKDVPTNHTFAGYIAYCAKEGIISGYADGTFRPAGTLTGYAFMKMLLGALGYDAEIEQYTGANWSINVAKKAINIGLNKSLEGEFNGIKAVNREEAALYAFNTLKSDLVEYETTISTTINGQTVTVGNSQAKAQKWNNSATRINHIKDDEYIQFAEQYFTKLELENTTDAFGRPSREWTFKGDEIGTYVNRDLLVESYTEKVTGKDLYDLLGKNVIADYDFDIYVDGETEKAILDKWDTTYFTAGNLVKGNDKKVGNTDNGVLTEVYRDSDEKEVTIAIINTYLAEATADYDTKREEASFKIWGIDDAGKKQFVKRDNNNDEILKASAEDFDVEDVEDGDIVLVTIAEGEIQTIAEPEVLETVEISAFKKGSNLTVDGTKYKYASTACYDAKALVKYTSEDGIVINLKETNYDVYLDPYGFVIGVEEIDPEDNYVFITGADKNYSNLFATTADMGAIFLDGTMDTIEVNVKKSDALSNVNKGWDGTSGVNTNALINTWCTYTVNDDGVYTLKIAKNQYAWDLGAGNTKDINKKSISLAAGDDGAGKVNKYVFGNDKTVYLNVSLENINAYDNNSKITSVISDVESVSVGIKNTDLEVKDVNFLTADSSKAADIVPVGDIYTVWDGGYAVGVVAIGEDQGVSSNYAYVTSGNVKEESYDKTNKEHTWTREVIIDGKLTDITYKGDTIDVIGKGDGFGRTDNKMDAGYWYKVTYYADGTVKNTEALRDDFGVKSELVGDIKLIEGATHDRDEDVVVYSEWFSTTAQSLDYEDGSLYVVNTEKTGFPVHPEAKVVLANADGKGDRWDDVDDSYVGYTGLETAISHLNFNFQGRLNAILEDGVATVIILDCSAKDPGYDAGSDKDTSDTYKVSLAVNASNQVELKVEGLKASIAAQDFTWTATVTSIFGADTELTSAGDIAAPTDNVTPKTDIIASTVNGLVTYQVTVTFDDGTVLTTNPVRG